MTDNDRIAALRAKAEGHESIEVGEYEDGLVVVIRNDLDTAATLLNALDPEAATLGHVIAKMKTIAGECVDGNHDNIARDDVVWLCIEIIRDFRGPAPEGYEWVLTLRRKVEK